MNPKSLIAFLILIFSGVFVFFLVLPQWRTVSDLRRRIGDQRKEVTRAREQFDATKTAIGQFKALKDEERDLVESALPQKIDIAELLVLTDSIISSSGLASEDIVVQEEAQAPKPNLEEAGPVNPGGGIFTPRFLNQEKAEADFGSATISTSVSGDYNSLKVLLRAFEQSSRIFDIQNMVFSEPKVSKEGPEILQFALKMKTYFKK